MRLSLLVFIIIAYSVSAHYCSCFPGSADFTGYMCTYSEPKVPAFDPASQSFKFQMAAEQLRANVGCVVKDNRTDCHEGSGCELDCNFDHCGVPISISNFQGEVVECKKDTGTGWNECDGDEFEYIFGQPDTKEIKLETDKRIEGSIINEKCGSSPYRINIPVEFKLTQDADEADYKITIRTTWDPDIYAPCDFSSVGIKTSCRGEECGQFIRESYSDFIVQVSLQEDSGSADVQCADCAECEGDGCGEQQEKKMSADVKETEVEGSGFPMIIVFILGGALLVGVGLALFVVRRGKPKQENLLGSADQQIASQQAQEESHEGDGAQSQGQPDDEQKNQI